MERVDQLRDGVKKPSIEYQNLIPEDVAIIVGVAVFPEHGATGEALHQSADTALYQTKQTDGNCVVLANGR